MGPSKWGTFGGTYPGAVVPFGMVQMTPETRFANNPQGYYYSDDRIYSFSTVNHMSGYPNGSAGRIKFMPFLDMKTDNVCFSSFTHDNEIAATGYYAVDLFDGAIRTELTATERTAFVRLAYQQTRPIVVKFLDVGPLNKIGPNEFSGKCDGYYFYLIFNVDVDDFKNNCMHFITGNSNQLSFKISVSQVCFENAKLNMASENSGWDFNKIKFKANQKWNSILGQIEIKDGNKKDLTVFYTALYHSFLLPFVSSDNNGEYRGRDAKVRNCGPGNYYSGFSPWDTFRTLHPLLTLLEPNRQLDMIKSLLLMYQHTGELFDGPMTGNHAIPIIVDSYFKGLTNFNLQLALEAMKSTICDPPFKKNDFLSYISNGYVPAEYPESVTRTLEYAYNDWALAEFTKSLGLSINEQLYERSLNYRNLFFANNGLMSPKFKSGEWSSQGGYKEGDAWNYSWFVPHNIKDLINLMGGEQEFSDMLETGFVDGKIIHDNEPVLNFGYLYNYAKKTWKTQKIVTALRNLYTNSPGGIPGNDDLGSMSSWFVFSALGFFPVCPGRAIYDLTTPLFSDITIHLDNNKNLEILTDGNPSERIYINSVHLKNVPLKQPWISHADVLKGGPLKFALAKFPNYEWSQYSKKKIPSVEQNSSKFTLDHIHLSSLKVYPNQLFKAHVQVKNTGSIGSQKLNLYVDDVIVDSKLVLVKKGEKVNDGFEIRLYQTGEHLIRINSLPSHKVTVLAKKNENSKNLQYSKFIADCVVPVGEEITTSVNVKNIGGQQKQTPIFLYIDGKSKIKKLVGLAPGQEKTIEFKYIPNIKGLFTIGVNDSLKQILKVYSKPDESSLLELSFENSDDNKFFDKSGFNNLVDIVGGVRMVKGKYGFGIKTGSDGFIQIAESPSLNISGKTLSVLAWIKPDNENEADIISQGDYNVLKMQNATTLNFIAGGWGRGECLANVPPNWNGVWHHIAGVCDSNILNLYVDGGLVQSIKVEGEIGPNEFPWNIGRNAEIPLGRFTNGNIDEVKIFKDALEQTEIQKIMSNNYGESISF